MPISLIDFSAGFENGSLGATKSVNPAYSTDVTFNGGRSLIYNSSSQWSAYQVGPSEEVWVSLAFRCASFGANPSRLDIIKIASQNILSGLYEGQNPSVYYGGIWSITTGMKIQGIATAKGYLNAGLGDLISPEPLVGEDFRTVFTEQSINLDTWYFLSTYTRIINTSVEIGGVEYDKIEVTISGTLNGYGLGSAQCTRLNPNHITLMKENGVSPLPTYAYLNGSSNWRVYFDNIGSLVSAAVPEGESLA